MMERFKNWECNSYRFSNKRKDYGYQDLKKYFFIDGSEIIYCKKDFGVCKAGNYYLVSEGSFYGCGFVVNDWTPFDEWQGKEYMKDGLEYKEGMKFIWHPMNRATKQVEVEHPHCGKIVTVIGLETMDRVKVSVDDFPNCNDRKNANQFVADKDELIPMKR